MADACTKATVALSRFGFDALGPADIVCSQTGAERLHYLKRPTKEKKCRPLKICEVGVHISHITAHRHSAEGKKKRSHELHSERSSFRLKTKQNNCLNFFFSGFFRMCGRSGEVCFGSAGIKEDGATSVGAFRHPPRIRREEKKKKNMKMTFRKWRRSKNRSGSGSLVFRPEKSDVLFVVPRDHAAGGESSRRLLFFSPAF